MLGCVCVHVCVFMCMAVEARDQPSGLAPQELSSLDFSSVFVFEIETHVTQADLKPTA